MAAPPDPWASFPLDPRDPSHARLRAADSDRDVVAGWLGTAYSEGRLDRDELEERQETLHRCKTLGELPVLVSDLMPARLPAPIRGGELARAGTHDLRRMAEQTVSHRLRAQLTWWLAVLAICWTVFYFTSHAFPWPAIVSVVGAARVIGEFATREREVERQLRKLEKKQRRQLKRPETPMGDY